MSAGKQRPLIHRMIDLIANISRYHGDLAVFNGHRIRQIENRLALLDGGDGAPAARRAALYAANVDRISDGKQPLGITLEGPDATMKLSGLKDV